jgi:hypothetical protein
MEMERAYTRLHFPQALLPQRAARAPAQATRIGGYKDSESKAEADDCIVCSEMKRSMVATPCGHISLCGGCATKLVQHTAQDKLAECPNCRAPVDAFYMTYQ